MITRASSTTCLVDILLFFTLNKLNNFIGKTIKTLAMATSVTYTKYIDTSMGLIHSRTSKVQLKINLISEGNTCMAASRHCQ